jgi:energy-converting hydrogenase B subunit Q
VTSGSTTPTISNVAGESANARVCYISPRVIPLDPIGELNNPPLAIVCRGIDRTGVLYEMTSVIVRHGGYIHSVDILERGDRSAIFWELYGVDDEESLIVDLESLDVVSSVERVPSMLEVFGKRIIVIGGGAQVGQVALGAIAEADRHNIRGEKISVDTIPIVGEANLANAVRAVPRLPRAVALVLAGALMGGEITRAVEEVRAKGVLVFSLNMAGSAPAAADLIVSDPVQAGVMAVMAVARTASFDISRQRGRVY